MGIREMEDRYRELREKFVAGAISREIYEAQVAQLRYQDAQGRYWAIGSQTGRWYVHEGGQWRLDKPLPPAAPRCPYCGQLLPPNSDFCVLCNRRAPAPPPPPVDVVSAVPNVPALTPQRKGVPWLALGRSLAGILLVLACGLVAFDGWLIYTRSPHSWAFLSASPTVEAPPTLAPATPAVTPIAGPGEVTPTPSPTPSPTVGLAVQIPYENAGQGFQLRYPSGWARAELRGAVVFAAHPDDLDARRLVDGRIFTVRTDVVTATTPQAAVEAVLRTQTGQDILIGQVQTGTLGLKPAAGVLMSFIPLEEDMTLKMYLLAAFHAGRVYVITASAPIDNWKAAWPAYQEMIQSFRFLEPPAPPTRTAQPTQTPGPTKTRTPAQTVLPTTRTPSPSSPAVSGYLFMGDGDIKISEPGCGQPFRVRGRISGLHEFAGRIAVKVRRPDGVVEDFAEAVQADGAYLLPTLLARGGDYLIWLADKASGERLSDHVQFAGVDPCQGTTYEINWKRRKT